MIIESKTLQRSLKNNLRYEFRSSIKFDLVNNYYRMGGASPGVFILMAESPELQLPGDLATLTPGELERLIMLNEKALDDVKALNKK